MTVSALRARARNAGDAGADRDGARGCFGSGFSSCCFWVGGDGLSWGEGGSWRCGLWRWGLWRLVRG